MKAQRKYEAINIEIRNIWKQWRKKLVTEAENKQKTLYSPGQLSNENIESWKWPKA